jgi:hypothetical protein
MAKATPQEQIAIAKRRERVLDLVKMGHTYRAIGRELGVSHVTVGHDFHTAMAETLRPKAESLRDLYRERDELLWQKASHIMMTTSNEDRCLRAIDRGLMAMERLARHDGTDAPSQGRLDVYTHDQFLEDWKKLEAEVIELENRTQGSSLS